MLAESNGETAVSFMVWRRLHRAASATIALIALLHSVVTSQLYAQWTADTLWFLAAGLGLLLIAVLNWAHVGLEPCQQPTAPVVRWANLVYVLLGVAALWAVPQSQTVALVVSLFVQAIAGR